MGSMDYVENNFEDEMLEDTSVFYSCKASNWIFEDSCLDHILKVSIPRIQPLDFAMLLLLSVLFFVKIHMLTSILMSMFLYAEECLKQ